MFVLRSTQTDGFAAGSVLLSDSGNDLIQVNNLIVEPSAQGRGCGRIHVDFVEGVARERGSTAMVLFTNGIVTENITLYARMGFVETERREEDGYERVYFRKDPV